ncbi:Transmembrane protein 258 [Frankliniella fusca]|uniref:Dolichyl-diphosphooligosaccharide-protein glycosyltransferase subunit TMEM258 n=1 Tax=Frankliniella fusca TaxID=407009 RepID=A0AAE1I239_9NEOP|nr:Transmembrane protein 258 [Frankliniella fusca]
MSLGPLQIALTTAAGFPQKRGLRLKIIHIMQGVNVLMYCFDYSDTQTILQIRQLHASHSHSMEIESMARYISPVNPAVFPHLTIVLLGIGIFFTAWFFVYEVTSTKYTRDIFKELVVALVAAIFSGMGVLFLMLWVGIYV